MPKATGPKQFASDCSLFLVHDDRDSPSGRCLVSQLFDVSCRSTLDQVRYEEVRVSWGSGIVGYVAQSKEAVNIPDCYNDSRFNKSIDLRTGYRTRCMLCMPIFDGEVIGVAQVLLDLARMVFEEQSTIEQIMTHLQSLLECERCQVLLNFVDHETKISIASSTGSNLFRFRESAPAMARMLQLLT
ncbi:hypothetical protein HPB49_014204 [Dermacentor silvarum]|uniref:Uncharacterized protein n=1 Tax=Dermacentor silvarum TaxID=543639 RepID=A0ACB8E0Q4_DERSI|nr:hypothetical protein HPB49_014204 [Dermacentor silvarum]